MANQLCPKDGPLATLSLLFQGEKTSRPLQILRQDPPWRVVRSFRVKSGESLVHLHNLSGGILSGDRLLLDVHVGRSQRVQLTSTGATRVYRHRADRPAAISINRIIVGDEAVLEYLPDQIIPYAHSEFSQETEVKLSPNDAGFFWWETITPGRTACGEKFAYNRLSLRSAIVCEGRPIAMERFAIRPSEFSAQREGRLGRFECSSTFYICRTGVPETRWIALEQILIQEAEALSGVEAQWGASRLIRHGIIVRGIGFQASELLHGLVRFWSIAKLFLYDREAVPLRKVH